MEPLSLVADVRRILSGYGAEAAFGKIEFLRTQNQLQNFLAASFCQEKQESRPPRAAHGDGLREPSKIGIRNRTHLAFGTTLEVPLWHDR